MKNSEPDPGTTIVLAAVVVYGVILVEIAMYLVATPLFMAATLALAIVMAGVVGRFITRVLDDDAGPLVPAEPLLVEVADRVEIAQPVVEPAPVRTSFRTRRRLHAA
jgi:hypothetical protein